MQKWKISIHKCVGICKIHEYFVLQTLPCIRYTYSVWNNKYVRFLFTWVSQLLLGGALFLISLFVPLKRTYGNYFDHEGTSLYTIYIIMKFLLIPTVLTYIT